MNVNERAWEKQKGTRQNVRKRSSFKLHHLYKHTAFVDKFFFPRLLLILILSLRSLYLVNVMPYLAFNLLISGFSFVCSSRERGREREKE